MREKKKEEKKPRLTSFLSSSIRSKKYYRRWLSFNYAVHLLNSISIASINDEKNSIALFLT